MVPILAALAALGLLGLLGQVPTDPATELIPFARDLYEAVIAGAWWKVGVALAGVLTVVTRWAPWPKLRTLPVQLGAPFALAIAGGLMNALAAGAGFSVELVLTTLQVAFTAAGGMALVTLIGKLIAKAKQVPVRINGRLYELPASLTLAELRAAAAISPGHAVFLKGTGGEPDTLLTTDAPINLELGDELYSLPLAATGK